MCYHFILNMLKIIRFIKSIFVRNKCRYCGCNIYTDDVYCSFKCTMNDNKRHIKN